MIQTRSSFLFINPVDTTNYFMDFDEGGPELTAEIEVGSYTVTDLCNAIEAAMNSVGAQAYTVTFDRNTRLFNISAPAPFTLLVGSGSHNGTDIYNMIGFTGADVTDDSLNSNVQAANEFVPQFWLQEYVGSEDYQKSISVSINKTTSGDVEVVKFGTEKFFEFNIKMQTNIDQGSSGIIETDLSGVENLRSFMKFCVEKFNLEFMPDRDDKNTFFKVLLESTASNRDGTGYKLDEMYDSGLPGYYETGRLTFRLRE